MGDLSNLDAIKFADNAEPRCPCVLLLDTSSSMENGPINALNQGLQMFKSDLSTNSLASKRVEVAVVAFNSSVDVIQDFVTADQFDPPTLFASGSTSMGGGIIKALDMIGAEKSKYKSLGVSYYRPWILLITDGEPTDNNILPQAIQRLRESEQSKSVLFFAVGVQGANMSRLREITSEPLMLQGLRFDDLFQWLSSSMARVSASQLSDQVALPPVSKWATT